ncbi:Regulatory protein AfsR [Actinomadura sp. RB99]|uniref:tetratricopeptide repeat protein n=1 Tax=Actinomadura sp. RB99 TaxID=2691577 RepID=UPI0016870AAF|nr:Regulatory protein AfsR [Actinomadura sp. RB99]
MPVPQTRNEISGGIVVGPAILGRDITVMLPPQVSLATSGLPAGSPAFTGRQRDLDRLLDSLTPTASADQAGTERAQAVVVTAVGGLAGVGKTELAVQAARAALRRGWFPGGVLFADLFGYDDDRRRDPGQVLEGMLGALGVPGEHIPTHAQDRSRVFRSILAEFAARGRRVLVVADNVNTPHQAELLLPTDGRNAAIVTSRHTLAMLDARLLDLNVLDVDDAVAMLDETLRIAHPHDTRIPGDPVGAAALAEACGYLPLALRIAAALLAEDPGHTPIALTSELHQVQPIEGLAYGRDGVRRAFELSYRTLTPDQRHLFRLLTVNPGPDTSTTAAAVLTGQDEPTTRKRLKDLARAHLIERGTAPDRWRMHDLVRQYATTLGLQHADTDQRDQALHRLLDHYLAATRAADAHLDPTAADPAARGFATREQALAWLDTELPNLTAAARTAADTGHPKTTVTLALALARFLDWRRLFNDWITLSTLARDTAARTGDRHGEGGALSTLGLALVGVRRFEEAVTAHQDAAAIYRELGDRRSEGGALNNLGSALAQVRRFDEAITAHQQNLAIFRETGDRHGEGGGLNNLGSALVGVGRFEEAIIAHQDAADIFRDLGDRRSEGGALGNLGSALVEVGRFEEAVAAHQDAAGILRELGDRHGEGTALNSLGSALAGVGRFEEAISAHQDAADIFRDLGDRHGEGGALNDLGLALVEAGRFDEAVTAHQQAAAFYHETGDRQAEGTVLGNLGSALVEMGRFDEAIAAHQQDLAICRELGDRHGEGTALTNLGNALRQARRFEEAIAVGLAAVESFAEVGDEPGETIARRALEETRRAGISPDPDHS